MLNETTLLNNLRIELGSKLFECLPLEWYINILHTRTLYLWSSYYPKLIKGIKITQSCAIPTIDPGTGQQNYHRYIIPKYNPEDEYIGIEKYIFNGQGWGNVYTGFRSPLADAAFAKVRSLQNIPEVRWRAEFEAPNFCEVYPYRQNHVDFSLIMQRMTRLNEIAFGYHESFIQLFVADVKYAIYREFPAARETGVLNGVEINTDINEFSSAKDERKEIMSELKDDYILDPSRFETILSQS
jgi:hypothetical protein